MFRNTKLHNTGIIADFDRTISKGGDATAFGVFATSPIIPKDLKQAQTEAYRKYRPIELNMQIPHGEKKKHMRDWFDLAMRLFQEHLTEEHLEETIHHAIEKIEIRDGFSEFIHFLKEKKVPLIIYSAGVSNIIKGVLNHHQIPHSQVYGNKLKFDYQGRCIGVENTTPVNNENKIWSSIPLEFRDSFADKTHVILLGDSLGDIKMAPGNKEVINIGFLIDSQKTSKKVYQDTFDLLIEGDNCDKGILSEIQKSLQN